MGNHSTNSKQGGTKRGVVINPTGIEHIFFSLPIYFQNPTRICETLGSNGEARKDYSMPLQKGVRQCICELVLIIRGTRKPLERLRENDAGANSVACHSGWIASRLSASVLECSSAEFLTFRMDQKQNSRQYKIFREEIQRCIILKRIPVVTID